MMAKAQVPPAPGPPGPPPIPDHELLRCIGRGSYGEVWLARNVMGTYRAVKILFRHAFQDHRPYEREYTGIKKFEPVSRSHEGFIHVLHVGRDEDQGCFYYVMELGDDEERGPEIVPASYVARTLAKGRSTPGRLPVDQCVELGLALTSALGHLHDQGLIHRDIKPSNIIFVRGAPKLADIGLVTEIGATPSYVGTEGFIPPEGPNGPLADIFSLGKVLYEISTGRDRNEFPDLPEGITRIPDSRRLLEFNEIVIKACHQDPARRYRSAREMHADLRVLQAGQSVRRLRVLERRLSAAKRLGLLAATVLLVTGLAYSEVTRRQREASAARQRQVGAHVAYGSRFIAEHDYLGALARFVEALRLVKDDREQAETQRLRVGSVFAQCPKLVRMWFLTNRVNDVRFSPNGQEVLMAEHSGLARTFNVASGQPTSPAFGPEDNLESLAWSPDGRSIATASQLHGLGVWEAGTGRKLLHVEAPNKVHAVVFDRSGTQVFVGCDDGTVRVWHAITGTLLRSWTAHSGPIGDVALSPSGHLLATSATRDATARLWRTDSGEAVGEPMPHGSWVYRATFSPDGTRLATACFDRRARLWDVPSGQELPSAMEHDGAIRSIAYTADGTYLVTASWDSTVRIWDARRGLPAFPNPILRHSARVMQAQPHPDGRRLVTSSNDGTVRLWDFAGSQVAPQALEGILAEDGQRTLCRGDTRVEVRPVIPGPESYPRIECGRPVESAALNASGRAIIVRTVEQPSTPSLQVWDAVTGAPKSPPIPTHLPLSQARLSRDSRWLALLENTSVRLIDTATGQPRGSPLVHETTVGFAEFSDDSTRLVTLAGRQVRVWGTDHGQELIPRFELPAFGKHARFSPDGQRLVTCPQDDQLTECAAQLWRVSTGRPEGLPMAHRDGILHAAFSPDGRALITAGEDDTAFVWDAHTGRLLTAPLRHKAQVVSGAFAPGGARVVTAGRDRMVRLWDAASGEPLTPPLPHPRALARAAFASDTTVVSVGDDGQTWRWELPRDDHAEDDLALLVRVYSGNGGSADEASLLAGTSTIRNAWELLARRCPRDLQVSRGQILVWHLRHADAAEADRHWASAVFHLDRLLALQPGEASWLARREQIASKLSIQPDPQTKPR